jgi:threonine synthase
MRFFCEKCGKTYPIDGLKYKCDCGGLFKLRKDGSESVELPISLGEAQTPLVRKEIYGARVLFKMDFQMPTGSFKDRGSAVLINKLKKMGIDEVVEDSSGNAGASIAAYCAAADIKCHIYVPESTQAHRIRQISAYGAKIVKVPGGRDNAASAAQEAAGKTYYASHVYNPLFFEGTKSLAYEIYVQIGFPDTIFVPAGNGTMLLGAYIGFKELGLLPRIIAVQSENCCPLYNRFNDMLLQDETKHTIAEGISIPHPPRLDEMVSAVRESRGNVMTVSEEEIKAANEMLGKMGIYVEDTSATVVAAARKYFKNGYNNMRKVVIPLSGTGLK